MEQQVHKPHRKSKEKKKHTGGKAIIFSSPEFCAIGTNLDTDRGADHNPKAFAFSNPGKLQRSAARSQDVRFFSFSHAQQSSERLLTLKSTD